MDELNEIRICELPDLHMLVSLMGTGGSQTADHMGEGMKAWADAHGFTARLGMRECLAYFDERHHGFIFMRRLPEDFVNTSPYQDITLKGGLEAVVSGERDHLVERYNTVLEWLGRSDRYELDLIGGQWRHPALLDWLTPSELHKRFDLEQQDILIPIRFR
jgi:hypothetical protein